MKILIIDDKSQDTHIISNILYNEVIQNIKKKILYNEVIQNIKEKGNAKQTEFMIK